jgi:hypothetical protein
MFGLETANFCALHDIHNLKISGEREIADVQDQFFG